MNPTRGTPASSQIIWLTESVEILQDANERLRQQNAELMDLLEELHAQVWGECPSLLNEDSGGDGDLDLRIQAAIAKAREAA